MNVPSRARTALSATLAAAVLVLAGCGQVRLETSPPPLPSANATEVARQSLALATATVGEKAKACSDGKNAKLYQGIAQRADQQLAALGGAWRPFATGTAAPHATPTPTPSTVTRPEATSPTQEPTEPTSTPQNTTTSGGTAPPSDESTKACDPVALGLALSESAAAARAVAVADPVGALGQIAASVSTGQYLDWDRLARSDDAATTRKPPAAPLTDANAPKVADAKAAATAIRNEDALGYLEEYVAGKLTDLDQRAALLDEAAAHRTSGGALANANGLTGAKDPRLAVYQLPADDAPLAELMAELDQMRGTLPQAYFDLLHGTEPPGRAALLSAVLYYLLPAERAGGKALALPCLT